MPAFDRDDFDDLDDLDYEEADWRESVLDSLDDLNRYRGFDDDPGDEDQERGSYAGGSDDGFDDDPDDEGPEPFDFDNATVRYGLGGHDDDVEPLDDADELAAESEYRAEDDEQDGDTWQGLL